MGVERVTVTLEGVDADGVETTGRVAGFRGHARGARVTFTPQVAIEKWSGRWSCCWSCLDL